MPGGLPSARRSPGVRVRKRCPRIAIYSEKGGVGKTALMTGVAAVAARRGLVVACIDMDPRATATAEFGIVNPAFTVNDILYTDPENPVSARGLAAAALLSPSEAWPQTIKVLAAERALGKREADPTPHMEGRLALSMEGGVLDDVDLLLIDVPPRAGGKLVTAALDLATHVMIPITLDEDGRVGAVDATKSVQRHAITSGREDLEVSLVVRNIVEGTATSLGGIVESWAIETYGEKLLPTRVPKYQVRKVSRFGCVPITDTKDAHTSDVVHGYEAVLDAMLKLEVAA